MWSLMLTSAFERLEVACTTYLALTRDVTSSPRSVAWKRMSGRHLSSSAYVVDAHTPGTAAEEDPSQAMDDISSRNSMS